MENKSVSERDDRLQKLNKLRDQGINPYPARSNRTHLVAEIFNGFASLCDSSTKTILCGRIRSKREHGNLTFIHLEDRSGQIQLAFSKKEIGDESYKKLLKFIDIGDFIEVEGTCFETHKGERSIMIASWRLLTKAILPLPDKYCGLKDEDDRLRKRYLDLLLDEKLRDTFIQKSKFWDVARTFMKSHGFFEVETPTLETTTGGAEANPFKTHHNDFDLPVFLRISVGELWQKRLMAAGFEKTFEIGRVYRNEGSSPNHLQEFTNMEFYWAYADYKDGMKLTRELYIKIAEDVFGTTKFQTGDHKYDMESEWPEIDYQKEILKQTGIDVLKTTEEEIKDKLAELNVKYEGENRERLTDTLWKFCRKNISGPAFLINHPKLISPLAKEKSDNPELTERFQIIIAGAEIGNGYSELNNPVEQRKRFEEQQKLLEEGDSEAMMPDWEFVEMLEHGMPPTCGFGFGERLFSFLVNSTVRETTLFPLMKPKNVEQNLQVKNQTNEQTELGITKKTADELIEKYITENTTKLHSIETEAVMKALAKHFGEDEEAWGIIGLLHDIDWEQTKNDVKNHTIKAVNILKEAGATDFLVESIVSHAYGNSDCGEHPDKKRHTRLHHALAAAETATGLIIASALMQPDKKLSSVKLSSLIKKFKLKSFAANCNRDIIKEIELTGLTLEQFFEISLSALNGISDKLSL